MEIILTIICFHRRKAQMTFFYESQQFSSVIYLKFLLLPYWQEPGYKAPISSWQNGWKCSHSGVAWIVMLKPEFLYCKERKERTRWQRVTKGAPGAQTHPLCSCDLFLCLSFPVPYSQPQGLRRLNLLLFLLLSRHHAPSSPLKACGEQPHLALQAHPAFFLYPSL